MPTAVQPIIVTADLGRLLRFYGTLLGGEETTRFPEEGPPFFVGLRIRDSELGLVADADADAGSAPGQRMLLSVDVPDVNVLLPKVEELGGHVRGPANDMAWGQRVAHIQDPDGNTVNLTQQL